MKAFKSVVVNELRANVLWGLLGLLSVSIVLAVILQTSMPIAGGEQVLPPFFTATSLLCAAVGLVIGLAQTLPENRGDRWSFLTHRPMTRTALFWARAVAGLILYAAPAGMPIVVALLWMSRPGHLAFPFDWRMAVPPLADFLCGVTFYFAGVLTAMRDARWHLTKTLGVVPAVVCLVAQTGDLRLPFLPQTFSGAMLWVGAGILVLATAAWGAFVSGGNYGTQPRIHRVATGVVFTVALAVLGGFVVDFGVSAGSGPSNREIRDYDVTSDGNIVKSAFDGSGRLVSIVDLQDRPIEKYRNRVGQNRMTLSSGVSTVDFFPDGWQWSHYRGLGDLFKNLGRMDGSAGRRAWYYVNRLGLIASFDPDSRRLMGWLGPDGFSPGDNPPPSRFEEDPEIGDFFLPRHVAVLLTFPDGIYRVVLDENRVEKVFTPQPGETIWAATAGTSLSAQSRAPGESGRLEVVLTSERILITELDGTVLALSHDSRPTGYGHFWIARARYAPGIPIFAMNWPQRNDPVQVASWDQRGNVLNQQTLQPLMSPPAPSTFWQSVVSAAFPFSLLVRLLWADIDMMLVILSAFSGLAPFLRGRAFAFSPGRLLLWTALGVLLGPLGFVVMLALLDWPARERCPACNHWRVVTRERCEHCREPFTAPKLDGTEIFERP